jgi:DNA-binding phage protein
MRRTGFDRYFDARMKDRKFAAAYAEARAEIDSVDALMQAVEAARAKAGLTKAELARRTGTRPEAMRRLFTTDTPNPTVATVMNILRSMGYSLALVPAGGNAKRARKAA